MSIALEGLRQIGAARVAALTEQTVRPSGRAGYAGFIGNKRALAILIRSDGETRLYPLDARAASWDAVDALCPGARAALDE